MAMEMQNTTNSCSIEIKENKEMEGISMPCRVEDAVPKCLCPQCPNYYLCHYAPKDWFNPLKFAIPTDTNNVDTKDKCEAAADAMVVNYKMEGADIPYNNLASYSTDKASVAASRQAELNSLDSTELNSLNPTYPTYPTEPAAASSPTPTLADLAIALAEQYARKNITYGDSFGKSVHKYGPISALTRMSDKWNRTENLILGGSNLVATESLNDTLIDLATYALMTVMALNDENALRQLINGMKNS